MTTPTPKPSPGTVDVADTLVEGADALGFLQFDLEGNLIADTREPESEQRDEPASAVR